MDTIQLWERISFSIQYDRPERLSEIGLAVQSLQSKNGCCVWTGSLRLGLVGHTVEPVSRNSAALCKKARK